MATVQRLIGGLRTATVHGFPINNEIQSQVQILIFVPMPFAHLFQGFCDLLYNFFSLSFFFVYLKAMRKGVSESIVGLIFATYSFVIFIFSPFCGVLVSIWLWRVSMIVRIFNSFICIFTTIRFFGFNTPPFLF